jgi:hypothetical protein
MEFSGGKAAIIPGASRGIGAGLVEAYREHGYAVIANSRTITDSPQPEVVTVAGDETIFDDPDSSGTDRNPKNDLAFGFGPHFCLGKQPARLELSLMLTRVLQRPPDLRLASGAESPLRPANFVSGPESVPVTFIPSAPLTQ